MAANTSTSKTRPKLYEAQDSVTRPANATQYAIGDALSDNATTATAAGVFTIPLGLPKGECALFTDFTLHKSDDDVTAADFDLLLFDTIPAFAGFEDNAACAITDAEMLTCKGVVRFVTTAVGDSPGWTRHGTGNIQTVRKPIGFIPTANETNLYGIIVLAATYTPASGEIFTLTAKWRLP